MNKQNLMNNKVFFIVSIFSSKDILKCTLLKSKGMINLNKLFTNKQQNGFREIHNYVFSFDIIPEYLEDNDKDETKKYYIAKINLKLYNKNHERLIYFQSNQNNFIFDFKNPLMDKNDYDFYVLSIIDQNLLYNKALANFNSEELNKEKLLSFRQNFMAQNQYNFTDYFELLEYCFYLGEFK